MRRNLILLWFLLPIFAYSQVRIDISPDFKHDTSKVSFWYVNGKRVEWQDFPVVITPMKMRLDTVIFVQDKNAHCVYDTAFILFPKKSKMMLVPSNDGSFDVLQKYSKLKNKTKAKFVVKSSINDTLICCFSSETLLCGQLFIGCNETSGWLSPFKTPYRTNMIQVSIYTAKDLNYYMLDKKDTRFFGDKNCSIVGWDKEQICSLSKVSSFKLRLFKKKRILIHFDNDKRQTLFSY